jgi:hypothetical protein
MKAFAALTLALSGAVAAVAGPAPDLPSFSDDPSARAPYSQVEMIGSVAVLNGGGSIEDVNYVKSRAGEFSLQILFSGPGGQYGVADKVTLRSAGRDVVTVADAGPYLMLKVPPGRYTVEAEFDGAMEQRSVTVGSSLTRVNWNTSKAD